MRAARLNVSRAGRTPLDALLAGIGFLAILPALYFVTGSILRYELGLLPTVTIYVFSPIVLLGGLVLGVVLNLYPLFGVIGLKVRGAKTLSEALRAKPWNLVVLVMGLGYLAVLLTYLIVENLTPH